MHTHTHTEIYLTKEKKNTDLCTTLNGKPNNVCICLHAAHMLAAQLF